MTETIKFTKISESVSDYLSEYNAITKKLDKKSADGYKKVKIAIISSSTISKIDEVLFVKCYRLGIIPEIYIGGYNQYYQEIIDENSSLYKFKPDIVIISIDTKSLMGDMFFDYYQLSEIEKNNLFENYLGQMNSLLDKIKYNLKSKIIFHNFEVPVNSPFGIIDNKQELSLIAFIKNINYELIKQYKKDSQVFIFDYDAFSSRWGKDNIIDYKMYYLGDIKINFQYMPKLCEEYVSYIKPLLSLTKKCIILDLDNTLWGGIVGEDGFNGIKLGPTPEGRPFLEFQKYLLCLFNKGIILAINSKNNEEDALKVIREHPYMILKEDNFAAIKINWNDKISNMKDIAKEINIGLDSMVFIDDDKSNQEMIRNALPEIKVVNMPDDPSLYLKTLMELNDFNSFQFSEEDKKKGQIYVHQKKRQELLNTITDITEYLAALNMVVTIENANDFTIPRISQLTQKTNQFNMTTKRYLEENIRQFSTSDNFLIISINVEDKFGDNGITGVAIVEKKNDFWRIDTFLLSCRIIGRKIEEVMLAYILEEARKHSVKKLVGEFIPTKKNAPAQDFYKENGFHLIEEKEGSQKWEFRVKEYKFPKFIKVIKR